MSKRNGFILAVLLAAAAWPSGMFGVDLVKDGKPNAVIVLPTNMSGAEGYAATELAACLRKITGASVDIRTVPEPGIYSIYLATVSGQLPAEVSKLYYKLKDDGFLIVTGKDAMYVTSRVPAGVIYGVYEILKCYGDVRWFYPGPEGEYVPRKPTFSVPEGVVGVNPSFQKRLFNLTGGGQNEMVYPTLQWMLRNNMTGSFHGGLYTDRKLYGGEDWWTLLPKELYRTNPELFPMVGGKRHVTAGKSSEPGYTNPCVSNPETVRIMTDSILRKINADRKITIYRIEPNDTTRWCECEDCKRLDSPADRINHSVSNRFWTFANALIKKMKETVPGIEITVSAYNNAENPPDTVKPDTRCHLGCALVRRCYIHPLQDKSCVVNRKFRERLEAWRQLGMPIWTYEYSAFVPQGSRICAPFEKIHSEDMKFYRKIGLIGYCDERAPIVEKPEKYFIKSYLDGGKGSMAESWRYDAVSRYFQAYFLWNADADFEAAMEDFGSKFYGKAWPEMKQYRILLRERYEKAPTHFLYGTPSVAAGRILDDASEKSLAGRLDKALALAAGDPAVCARILREKEVLEGLAAKRRNYQAIRDLKAAAGRVGAAPSEKDWDAAPAVTDFTNIEKKAVGRKTSAKVLYDAKNLYFRVESFDDSLDKLAARVTERDGVLWNDSTVEFFLAPPALGGRYLHLIVNPLGTVFDAMTLHPSDSDKTFDARAAVKVRKENDRWIADVAIPFESLGGAPNPGDEWKINIARGRVLSDGSKGEYSSWSLGEFHGTDMFRTTIFGK